MTQATDISGAQIPFKEVLAMPPGIKLALERQVGRSLSDEEARSLMLLHGGFPPPSGSQNITPDTGSGIVMSPSEETERKSAGMVRTDPPPPGYDPQAWERFRDTEPPAGWGPGGTRGLSTPQRESAAQGDTTAGGLKGLFTRGDGMGFRILQMLGQLGGGIANRRAIKEANQQNRQSQARANLMNALSRRRVAEGTNVQPSLGLLGTLSDVVSGAGKAGLDIQQFGRSEEDRKLKSELERRRVASGEKTADAYALNARANLLQRLAGKATKEIEWSDNQVESFARRIANLELVEDETWEEKLERAGISTENVSQKSKDFLRSWREDPLDPEKLDQGTIEIFAKDIRAEMERSGIAYDEAIEQLGYGDLNWDETSRAAVAAWRPDDKDGAGGDGSATGKTKIAEASAYRAEVKQIRDLWNSGDVFGTEAKFWDWLGFGGVPDQPETGQFAIPSFKDMIFGAINPEDVTLRGRLLTFSIKYAAAANQGRPTEPDRIMSALSIPNPFEHREIGEMKLRIMEEMAIIDEVFKRYEFGGYAPNATDDDVMRLGNFINYAGKKAAPLEEGWRGGVLDADMVIAEAVARGLPKEAGDQMAQMLVDLEASRAATPENRGGDGGPPAKSQGVADTNFRGLSNEALDRIAAGASAAGSQQDTTGSE